MKHDLLLRSHGMKATSQRMALLHHLHEEGHITIEALYEKLSARFVNMSLATIYKNIHIMLEKRLLTEVKIPGLKQQYEITKAPHSHLICDRCQTLSDIDYGAELLLGTMQEQSGYTLHTASLILIGCCPECQRHAS